MPVTTRQSILSALALLNAAKVDEFKEKNPEIAEEIDALNEADPTPTKKYLAWGTKLLIEKQPLEDIVDLMLAFHKEQRKLQQKDINQYKTLDELRKAIDGLEETEGEKKAARKTQAKKDAEYLYHDDKWLLVHPKSMKASCHYGMGAKWCISATESTNYFNNYSKDNVFFYFLIDKQAEPKSQWSKAALCLKKGDRKYVHIYDVHDKQRAIHDALEHFGADLFQYLAIAYKHCLKQEDTWQYTLEQSSDEADLRRVYAEHKEEAASILVDNKACPSDILGDIASSADLEVQVAVAKHPKAGADTLRKLSKSPSGYVRKRVAHNDNVPEDVIDALAMDEEIDVRSAAIKSDKISMEMLLKLARQAVEKNDSELAEIVIENDKATKEVLDIALQTRIDSSWKLKEALRDKDISSDAVLRQLSMVEDVGELYDLATAAARNNNASQDVLSYVWSIPPSGSWHYRLTEAKTFAIGHKNFPTDKLAEAAASFEAAFREAVASNHDATPPEILSKLAEDDSDSVLSAVALNPSTPPEALAKLATKTNATYILQNVARHPNTPAETLRTMADNRYAKEVAVNPSCPPDLLASLMRTVPTYAIQNKNASKDLLLEVANWGSDFETRRTWLTLADREDCPPEVLDVLANKKLPDAKENATLRYRIIRNPSVSSETLEAIYRNNLGKVREEAKKKLEERGIVLKRATRKKAAPAVEARLSALAERLHSRNLPVSVLLAIEEAADAISDGELL